MRLAAFLEGMAEQIFKILVAGERYESPPTLIWFTSSHLTPGARPQLFLLSCTKVLPSIGRNLAAKFEITYGL